MTDIAELVRRMRGLAEYVDDCDEAADALEAQEAELRSLAKEIAELEYEAHLFDEALEIANARIAELEAALKETLAIAERNELGEYQLRARAALKGEKAS
jgi:hypothetical protein